MIATYLKSALESSKLPVRELAALSGISTATLFKFRKDPNASLTLANAEALAGALGFQLTIGPKIEDHEPEVIKELKGKTTDIGFINRNNQQVVSSHLGILKGRPCRLYMLRCNNCIGPIYESHSFDIWQRRCPNCQKKV